MSSVGSLSVLLFWLCCPPWALHGGETRTGASLEAAGPGSTYSTLQFSCCCPSGGPDCALCSGYLPLFCVRSASRVSFTARPPTKGLRRPQRGSLSGRRQQSLRSALWAAPHPLFPCRGKGRPEASLCWEAVGLERWREEGAGLQPKQQQWRFLVSASYKLRREEICLFLVRSLQLQLGCTDWLGELRNSGTRKYLF